MLGAVDIRHSTISGNTATVNGGGLYFYGSSSINIENSTIVSNNTGGSGGGVFWNVSAGSLNVRNSTVTSNTANATVANRGGGGIFELGDGVPLVANSVVSGNTNANGPDILSRDLADGPGEANANFSAIGSNTGFILSGSSANNLAFGTDPLLGPLQDNGGPTQTRLPTPFAADQRRSNGLVPASPWEQRGPCYRRILNSTVDIGLVEVGGGVIAGEPIFCNGFEPESLI